MPRRVAFLLEAGPKVRHRDGVAADVDRPGEDGRSVYVAFLDRFPTAEAAQRLVDRATEDDTFAVVGREAYWLRRGGIGTSRFSGGLLEKILGMPATVRGMPTIARILAKGR